MTVLEFAGLIAALAFVVIVVFAILLIVDVRKSLKVITKHTESLAIESNQLLDQMNLLASDVNAKSSTLDPAVKAIADLGSSVSNVKGVVSGNKDKSDNDGLSGLVTSFLGSSMALSIARRILRTNKKKKTTK